MYSNELHKLKPGTLLQIRDEYVFSNVTGYTENFKPGSDIPCGSIVMFIKYIPNGSALSVYHFNGGTCKILIGNEVLYVAGCHLKILEEEVF